MLCTPPHAPASAPFLQSPGGHGPLAPPSGVGGPGINVNSSIFLSLPQPNVASPISCLAKPDFYWWRDPKVTSTFSFLCIYPSGPSLDWKRARYPFLEGTGLTHVQGQARWAPGGKRLYFSSCETRLCSEIRFLKREFIQAELRL